MPLAKYRVALLAWLFLILTSGSFATTIASYIVSRDVMRRSISDRELPLTSDSLYSEIQKDLVRPILISKQMANNTLLQDWIAAGEKEHDVIQRYLTSILEQEKAVTSFYASEQTRQYHYPGGVLEQLRQGIPDHEWFFRVRQLQEPYELNVAFDTSNQKVMTVFVNYRMLDAEGQLLGITGVGLSLNKVADLIEFYESRYHRRIYFLDQAGKNVFDSSQLAEQDSIYQQAGIRKVASQLLSPSSESVQLSYQKNAETILVSTRYVEDLKLFLVVEQNEKEAFTRLRQTLSINLLLGLISSTVLLITTLWVVNRYQIVLEKLASIDVLTGLENRLVMEERFQTAIAKLQQAQVSFSAILLDIDHFKRVNDTHGHLAGDKVILTVAQISQQQIRGTDHIFRWGGEEFLVLLNDCKLTDAQAIAEKIRNAVEQSKITLDNGSQISVTVSLGVGESRLDEAPKALVNRIDQSLYSAKQKGRNRVEVNSSK